MISYLCKLCGRYFDVDGKELHNDNIYETDLFVCDTCKEEEEEEGGGEEEF